MRPNHPEPQEACPVYIVMRSSASSYYGSGWSRRGFWHSLWTVAVVELDTNWVVEQTLKERSVRPKMISMRAKGVKRIVDKKVVNGKLRDETLRAAMQLAEQLNKAEQCIP